MFSSVLVLAESACIVRRRAISVGFTSSLRLRVSGRGGSVTVWY